MGTSAMSLPKSMMPDGANISVAVSAVFGWSFYLAILVAILCIGQGSTAKK